MNVSLQNIDKVSALLTVKLEKADYQEKVDTVSYTHLDVYKRQPLCIWDFEDKLKKGDNLIFTAFGAGFTWGAVYVLSLIHI